MPLKTILFLALFVTCAVGALWMPLLGVAGYVAHYCIGPERQWWAGPIREWGLRYSYLLALLTAVGIVLHFRGLRFGRPILRRQEWLLILFLGVVWLSWLVGEETESYTTVDHPTIKMTKVLIFTLMMTHVVTTIGALNVLTWVLIGGALVLGLQAYSVPLSQFTRGRLETVGGPDFSEANFLPAFLGAVLPLVAVQFLRAGWLGKLLCLGSGVFATNAIILARSRGAVAGIAVGLVAAVFLAPRRYRTAVLIGLAVAAVGAYALMDPGFVRRTSSIGTAEDDLDWSARSRLVIWRASWRLLKEHPFGVGAGNFFQEIGNYVGSSPDIPEDRTALLSQADAHSTFVRCYSELGIHGLVLLGVVMGHALWICHRVQGRARALPSQQRDTVALLSYGVVVGLIAFFACGATMTLLYVEAKWWLLALPVCMERAVENALADHQQTPQPTEGPS